jgi:hypothetical protein
MTEEPNELTILLRVVEVVELSLRKSVDRPLDNNERAQVVRIVNKFGSGSIFGSFIQESYQGNEGVSMGDQYTVGQAGAVGPSSHAEHMTFNQIWSQLSSDVDLAALATELVTLRTAMREQATKPEDDLALAEVGQAQLAADRGDGPTTMSHLCKAGKWALDTATTIGTQVAAAAIKSTIGLA